MDILALARECGINVRSTAHGTYRDVCPKCSQSRKKKFDKCLSIRIDGSGLGWKCFNCGFLGGILDDDFGSTSKIFGKAVPKRGHRDTYGDLLRQARGRWVSLTG